MAACWSGRCSSSVAASRILAVVCVLLCHDTTSAKSLVRSESSKHLAVTSCSANDQNPKQCQSTGGCMWHLGACVPRPENHGWHCYNGSSPTPNCFDVAACAKAAPSEPRPDAKWAFVYTHSAPQDMHDWHDIPDMNVRPLVRYAREMGNMDVLLLLPKPGVPIDGMGGQALEMPKAARKRFEELGVIIKEVPWALPPGMQFLPNVNWCGSKDLMRLHVMGLEGYASVVYMDFDVQMLEPNKQLHPQTKQLFQCAAQNKILWTGDVMGPMNIGVFAVKPHPTIRDAGVNFVQMNDFNRVTGWGNTGFAPDVGPFIGAECGQGAFHTMFFKTEAPGVQQAMQQAGGTWPEAQMIDLCKWNYLHGWECPKEMSCDDVVFVHKGTLDKWGCRQRQKFGFYIHAHWEAAAILNQIRSIRRYHRESPIYIMSDGGLNFTKMCDADSKQGTCTFVWKPPANDRWNPKPFLERFREAAIQMDTDYVVMLEPDVTLHDEIRRLPTADAGGLKDDFNPALSKGLRDHLVELGRKASNNANFSLPWDHFGLAGGSIYRTEAVVNSFKPDNIDWRKMEALDGLRIYSSDIAMAIALAAHGYTYAPWDDVKTGPTSAFVKSQPEWNTAFQHHGSDEKEGKPLYGKELEGKDKELFEAPPSGTQDINCQHCVWADEKKCWPSKEGGKIGCPIDQPALGISLLQQSSLALSSSDVVSHHGNSGMLVLSTAIQDGVDLGSGGLYPSWFLKILPNTAKLAEKFGHSHIVRTRLTGDLGSREAKMSPAELSDWEKLYMLNAYLNTGSYSHVLFLDPAATFAHPDRDTVRELAKTMEDRGASVLSADEDWSSEANSAGSTKLNSGVLMVRNTPYARKLLSMLLVGHERPANSGWQRCGRGTMQQCFRAFLADDGHREMPFEADDEGGKKRTEHVIVLSGQRYNRSPEQPCRLSLDPSAPCNVKDVDIVHFVGNTKHEAGDASYGVLLQQGEGDRQLKGQELLNLFPLKKALVEQ